MFTMLGPVRWRHQRDEVILGPPKVNAFLVALLLNTDKTVSIGQMMGLLWDTPPPSAESNLRSFASRLRRKLRGIEATIEGSQGNGFSLIYPRSQVDVLEFRRLTDQARIKSRGNDHFQAYQYFKEALALWRGPAGTGSRGSGKLDSVLCALDQEHSAVTEEMFRSRLLIDDVDGLANDLRQHLSTRPFHDLPWNLLIRAEVRCGNVSAALAAYEDYCTNRAADLGMRPSEKIRDLYNSLIDDRPLPALTTYALQGVLPTDRNKPNSLAE